MTAFEAVLWDYGGVFTPSPLVAAHAYARARDADPDHLVTIVFGSYDADTDHAWHQLERGELTFVDTLTRIKADAEAAGMRFDTGEMFSGMVADDIDRTIVIDAVRARCGRGGCAPPSSPTTSASTATRGDHASRSTSCSIWSSTRARKASASPIP